MHTNKSKGHSVRLNDVPARILDTTNYAHSGGGEVWDLLTPERAGTQGLILGTASYNPGTVTWAKVHTFEEAAYVVSGRGTFYVEDDVIPLEPGTALVIPPRVRHYLKNDGTEPLVFFFATSPPPALAPKFPETGTSSKRVDS